jgi:hypothetical protein
MQSEQRNYRSLHTMKDLALRVRVCYRAIKARARGAFWNPMSLYKIAPHLRIHPLDRPRR